jgi:hypothetical protein
MNMIKSVFFISLLAITSVVFVRCNDDDPTPTPVVATTFSNLPADPGTGFDPNTGQPTGTTGKFTLFSFKTGTVVPNADSATAKWDLGFRATTIIVNSATSGSGTAQVQIISGIFDALNEAPVDGYKSDYDPSPIAGAPNADVAIPTGSGNGWYTYDGAAMVNKPTAGKIIVVKTADGGYAKMEILSYYKDAPAAPVNTDIARYYTFRYVYQPNDTRSFK